MKLQRSLSKWCLIMKEHLLHVLGYSGSYYLILAGDNSVLLTHILLLQRSHQGTRRVQDQNCQGDLRAS